MASNNPTPPPISGRWKPGQSGNPGGRPKKKPLTEAMQRMLNKLSDAETEALLKSTFEQVMNGNIGALKEVCDRVEGRVVTPLETTNVIRVVSAWDE